MQYHIYNIIHTSMILLLIFYDIKVIYYDIIEIYDIIVAQGSRWPHPPGRESRGNAGLGRAADPCAAAGSVPMQSRGLTREPSTPHAARASLSPSQLSLEADTGSRPAGDAVRDS
jgi:hypothetical protein